MSDALASDASALGLASQEQPSASATEPIVIRHFRQVVLWPLQLVSNEPAGQLQRHWESLQRIEDHNPWREPKDECGTDYGDFQERHYREFVTFLPFVQRFLYGEFTATGVPAREGEPSLRTFRREDIAGAQLTYADGATIKFGVAHVDLHFFLDADVVILALEMFSDELPLQRAQDTLFRFGRTYPTYWDTSGGGNCLRRVDWLSADGTALATSDYDDRARFVAHVGRHRAPCFAAHWEYLLRPLLPEYSGHPGLLRYRQLEYHRLPLMAYLAVDDPTRLTRADFIRLGLVTRPAEPDLLPYSESSTSDFEREFCEDRFWLRPDREVSGNTRLICGGNAFIAVGECNDRFFVGKKTGFFGQFRHQYFLLFLIAHFHRAALLSMSDRLAYAMSRLDISDTQSVKRFKREIRRTMEVFLRFSQRYWFHEVSNQPLARDVFRRIRDHLGNEPLCNAVRIEVQDMNDYLDSDSLRRQANTILRLTVVTTLGLIGTVATGFLGMNLIAAANARLDVRILIFALTLVGTTIVTVFSIVKSKRMADFLDSLSDERIPWRTKWRTLRRIEPPRVG
ncbi:MAG: CorA family divalent cation transporter [Steroidobacteraceae bacterium]